MNKKLMLLAVLAASAIANAGYAAQTESYQDSTKIQKDSNGNYNEKDKTTKTDAAGTTTTTESEAKVRVDAKGNTDKSTTTKEVTDPKGLFNKKTVETSNTEKVKDGVVETKQEVIVNGKTVESTSQTAPK